MRFIRARLNAIPEAIFIDRENRSKYHYNKDGVSHPDEAEERQEDSEPIAIINASGLGFNDEKSFPSRGQFIIVSNEYDKTISHHRVDGSSTVIIPRPLGGGTVIGGTKEPNNW